MLTVGSIVIRCRDLERQLMFWTAALDYAPRLPIDDDFALLRPRAGEGPNLSLDAHARDARRVVDRRVAHVGGHAAAPGAASTMQKRVPSGSSMIT